jgi:hypothetical protein
LRLAVRASAEIARIETEGSGVNTYDCRFCRSNGWHRTERACLLDLDTALVSLDGSDCIPVDRDTAVALCPDRPGANILASFRRWHTATGRALCFVPCIRPESQELLASEIDAEKYHWSVAPSRWTVEAFRTIRSERAGVENDRYRKMKSERDKPHA